MKNLLKDIPLRNLLHKFVLVFCYFGLHAKFQNRRKTKGKETKKEEESKNKFCVLSFFGTLTKNKISISILHSIMYDWLWAGPYLSVFTQIHTQLAFEKLPTK